VTQLLGHQFQQFIAFQSIITDRPFIRLAIDALISHPDDNTTLEQSICSEYDIRGDSGSANREPVADSS